MRNLTQASMVREHLLSGKTLTPLEALADFRCYRLSAVIYDLRKEGLPIETKIMGNGFARYYIEPANDNKESA